MDALVIGAAILGVLLSLASILAARLLIRHHLDAEEAIQAFLVRRVAHLSEDDVIDELDRDPYFGREYARPKRREESEGHASASA